MGVEQAAKLNGRGSKPEIAGETPCKKAQGVEASFLFRIDRKRVHASAKGGPAPGSRLLTMSKHAAHQGGGTHSPQGLTALFGSTTLSGVPADKKKIKGKPDRA